MKQKDHKHNCKVHKCIQIEMKVRIRRKKKFKCGEKRKKIKANKQTNHTECYNQPILDIIMHRTRLLLL